MDIRWRHALVEIDCCCSFCAASLILFPVSAYKNHQVLPFIDLYVNRTADEVDVKREKKLFWHFHLQKVHKELPPCYALTLPCARRATVICCHWQCRSLLPVSTNTSSKNEQLQRVICRCNRLWVIILFKWRLYHDFWSYWGRNNSTIVFMNTSFPLLLHLWQGMRQ